MVKRDFMKLKIGTVHQLRAECDAEILLVVFRNRKK